MKKKKFIPCGEGKNICNCKSSSECGYLERRGTYKNIDDHLYKKYIKEKRIK